MIWPDPLTQFILYMLDGVHIRGWSRSREEVDVILAWNCVVIYVMCEALHCHAGKCQAVILHEMTNYLKSMNPVKTSNNDFRSKRLLGWVDVFTRCRRNVVTLVRSGLCTSSDITRSVVPVHKIMNSRSRAPPLMRYIIYRRPRFEPANNMASLVFWKTCRH